MTTAAPHNLEAERAVLGAALQEPEAAALAVSGLHPSDFYPDAHQNIFRAILGLSLLLAGCASTRIQTAGEPQERYWVWCDRVQQNHPTVLCFQQ